MVDDAEDVQKTHSMAKMDEVREAGGRGTENVEKVQVIGKGSGNNVNENSSNRINKSSKFVGKEVSLNWLGNNYKAVEIEGSVKVNGKEMDISRRIYQRVDIDWNYIPCDDSVNGLSNRELVEKGRPPFVVDKNGVEAQIELHHIIQKESGDMVEIIATTHDEYTKILP
jgi:hypothetical protein